MTIVFDIDGTLVDSTRRHIMVLKDALNNNNLNYDDKLIENFVSYKSDGKNTMSFLVEILKIDSDTSNKIFEFWKRNIENSKYIINDILYFDTIDVLESLYKKNNIVFLSARQNQELLEEELSKLGILKYCDDLIVVNPSNAINEKMLAIKNVMHDNDDIIMVGDTEVDNSAAISLNVGKYILNRGFRSKLYWDNQGIKSYNNLLELKENLNGKL